VADERVVDQSLGGERSDFDSSCSSSRRSTERDNKLAMSITAPITIAHTYAHLPSLKIKANAD